jgi:hypothetical protein
VSVSVPVSVLLMLSFHSLLLFLSVLAGIAACLVDEAAELLDRELAGFRWHVLLRAARHVRPNCEIIPMTCCLSNRFPNIWLSKACFPMKNSAVAESLLIGVLFV